MDIRNKEQAVVDKRLRMLEAMSRSPTALLRQQLSTIAISNQTAAPTTATAGDPFTNSTGGQGNLRFSTNPSAPRQNKTPFAGQPRPNPTPEQKAEIRIALSKFPHHPDTLAGRQAHQAQQAEWVKLYGYGTRVMEKTPYPLRPGTASVNSVVFESPVTRPEKDRNWTGL